MTFNIVDADPDTGQVFRFNWVSVAFFAAVHALALLAPWFFSSTAGSIAQIPLGVGLYLLGGWSLVIYGLFLRAVLLWHSTWLINSASHITGYRTQESDDNSRNLWWVIVSLRQVGLAHTIGFTTLCLTTLCQSAFLGWRFY